MTHRLAFLGCLLLARLASAQSEPPAIDGAAAPAAEPMGDPSTQIPAVSDRNQGEPNQENVVSPTSSEDLVPSKPVNSSPTSTPPETPENSPIPAPVLPPSPEPFPDDAPRPDPASFAGPIDESRFLRAGGSHPLWLHNLDRLSFDALRLQMYLLPGSGDREAAVDLRIRGLRGSVPLSRDYRAHDRLWSLGFETLNYERFLSSEGSSDAMAQAFGGFVRYDAEHWGVTLATTLLTGRADELSGPSPWFGLRFGRAEEGLAVIEARFPGLYLLSSGELERSLSSNFDLGLSADFPLSRVWRAQLRARFRGYRVQDLGLSSYYRRRQDQSIALGLEAALPLGFRVLPCFVGLGWRQVHTSTEAWERGDGNSEWRTLEGKGEQQLVLIFEVAAGLHGASSLW
jgi:hypothetical protein